MLLRVVAYREVVIVSAARNAKHTQKLTKGHQGNLQARDAPQAVVRDDRGELSCLAELVHAVSTKQADGRAASYAGRLRALLQEERPKSIRGMLALY
jgi:hypothetical protein